MYKTRTLKRLNSELLDVSCLSRLLPKVGDRLIKIPTMASINGSPHEGPPTDCVVTYVNKDHLWYEVQFLNEGINFKESYKLPDVMLPRGNSAIFYPGERIQCVKLRRISKK